MEYDYNKIKLGLIDRFRVYRERRAAEKNREWYDKVEHEVSEVDYSEADKLEKELLDRKKIKKATRDAKKIYRRDDKNMNQEDFIENYLIEIGLKPKALPKQVEQKKHSFMEQYHTEKTEDQIKAEQSQEKKEIYYRIGDKDYKLPDKCLTYASDLTRTKDVDVPFEDNGNGRYTILNERMNSFERIEMLKFFNSALVEQLRMYFEYPEENQETYEWVSGLPMKDKRVRGIVDKLVLEGKKEEAYELLNNRIQRMAEFRDEKLQSEQEQDNAR